MNFEGKGYGYFGDDDHRVREHFQRETLAKIMRVGPQEGLTDGNGRVTLLDVPIGAYTVEVDFSQDFNSAS